MRWSLLLLLPVFALAPLLRAEEPVDKPKETKPEIHPHLRAAKHYERQAEKLAQKAAEAPDAENKAKWMEAAENCKKLAQMKRDALESEKQGKPYDWKAYQEIRAKNAALIGEEKPEGGKPPHQPGETMPKPEVPPMPKPEAAPMPETVAPDVAPANPTKLKTKSGFEVKTKIGE